MIVWRRGDLRVDAQEHPDLHILGDIREMRVGGELDQHQAGGIRERRGVERKTGVLAGERRVRVETQSKGPAGVGGLKGDEAGRDPIEDLAHVGDGEPLGRAVVEVTKPVQVAGRRRGSQAQGQPGTHKYDTQVLFSLGIHAFFLPGSRSKHNGWSVCPTTDDLMPPDLRRHAVRPSLTCPMPSQPLSDSDDKPSRLRRAMVIPEAPQGRWPPDRPARQTCVAPRPRPPCGFFLVSRVGPLSAKWALLHLLPASARRIINYTTIAWLSHFVPSRRRQHAKGGRTELRSAEGPVRLLTQRFPRIHLGKSTLEEIDHV